MFEKSIIRLIETLVEPLAKEVRFIIKNRLLEYQVSEYKRNINIKTVLHRHAPVNLLKVYQPLHLRKHRDSHTQFDFNHYVIQRINIDQVANLFKTLNGAIIVGNAGSGKSTFLKYLFIKSIEQEFKTPILIELRNYCNSDQSILDYIYDRVMPDEQISKKDRHLERLLNSGSFLIIFDGHDEVGFDQAESVTVKIDQFVASYPNNNYIISSRSTSHIGMLPTFSNFTIDSLMENEVISLVKKQLDEFQIDDYSEVINSLKKVYNSELRAFLSNPLLLSMYVLCFQYDSNIPSKKSTYYSHVFNSLYSSHDTLSKFGYIREKRSGLNKEQFISILSMFSILSYFESKYEFSQEYINEKLDQISKVKKHLIFKNDKIIFDLNINICILLKDGLVYKFHHRSIQEYFAALYIKNIKKESKNKIYNKISSVYWSGWDSREHFNLMSFLVELDEYHFVKFIISPAIDRIMRINAGQNLWGWLYVNDFCKLCELLTFLDEFQVYSGRITIGRSDIIRCELNNNSADELEMSNTSLFKEIIKNNLDTIASNIKIKGVEGYLLLQNDYIRQIKVILPMFKQKMVAIIDKIDKENDRIIDIISD